MFNLVTVMALMQIRHSIVLKLV